MAMSKNEVFALLEANRNERGIKNWKKMGLDTTGLTSHGIGLTQLRKLARQVGRDHDLAGELWNSDNYDSKTIGPVATDPKDHCEPTDVLKHLTSDYLKKKFSA